MASVASVMIFGRPPTHRPTRVATLVLPILLKRNWAAVPSVTSVATAVTEMMGRSLSSNLVAWSLSAPVT